MNEPVEYFPESFIENLRLLRRLSERPFHEEEREILWRVCAGQEEATRALLHLLGLSEVVIFLSLWHARFHKSLTPEPPPESVLCAFTSVVDRVLNPAGWQSFLTWASKSSGLLIDETIDRAEHLAQTGRNSQGGDLRRDVHSPLDIVGALLYFIRNPPAHKPLIKGPTFLSNLRNFLAGLPPGQVREVLGGAAAVIAEVLSSLGVGSFPAAEGIHTGGVRLYCLYHSPAQAATHGPATQRLVLPSTHPNSFIALPARESGSYEAEGQTREHPAGGSLVFAYDAGFTLGRWRARQADRAIFRHAPFGLEPTGWSQIRLYSAQGEEIKWPEIPAGGEWPWLPGFLRWWVEGGALHLSFAGQALLEAIAQAHHYIIIGGLGPELFVAGDTLREMIATEVARQLHILAEAGATLHLELSGVSGEMALEPFAQAMRGAVRSLGVNEAELEDIARRGDFQAEVSPGADPVFQRYERALALARQFSLERLYVHGNEVDLILRRSGSPGDMRQEIAADLFAKGVVVLAILQRSVADWREQMEKLAPVLLWRGFRALIAFAWSLANARYKDNLPARDALFKRLIEGGYSLPEGREDYAVAVVPVMWPQLPAGIYSGGAGDICSGVSLVYSGF